MIDIKALEKSEIESPSGLTYFQHYKNSLRQRGWDESLADKLLEMNTQRKQFVTKMETARAEQKKVGEEIARRKRSQEDASSLLENMQKLSHEVKELDQYVQEIEVELNKLSLSLPNRLHSSVPIGDSASDNQVLRVVGEKKPMDFQPREHGELGELLNIIDFERAGKVTGARFAFLRGGGALLERGLIQFMMDLHVREHGYEEMIPPFMVNEKSLVGTGQFPKFRDDVFHLEGLDYHLIPTAEVPVTNFFAHEILRGVDLPIAFCAYSPCFRSEAGSYGKDTKGLIRQHQFNKVELVMFVRPETSYEMHEKLTNHAERVLQALELPYRVVNLCSKDIGFGAARCFDLEVWLPGQNQYREISSCSNFEDFQARRAQIRFKDGDKDRVQFVHTLNGSGLAVGRTLIAILENYQQADGTILVPKALQPYVGGQKEIRRR